MSDPPTDRRDRWMTVTAAAAAGASALRAFRMTAGDGPADWDALARLAAMAVLIAGGAAAVFLAARTADAPRRGLRWELWPWLITGLCLPWATDRFATTFRDFGLELPALTLAALSPLAPYAFVLAGFAFATAAAGLPTLTRPIVKASLIAFAAAAGLVALALGLPLLKLLNALS